MYVKDIVVSRLNNIGLVCERRKPIRKNLYWFLYGMFEAKFV